MDDDERKDIRAGRTERWQDSQQDLFEPVPYYWALGLGSASIRGWSPLDGPGRFSTNELDAKHGEAGWTAVDRPEVEDDNE